MRKFGFFALCALSLAAAAALPARQTKEKPLQYESFVTVKLLQVYVTGKKDAPVTDLTAADFEIIDNGKSFPVAHFEKHFAEAEGTAAPAAAPAAAEAPPLGRKFFLVFDFVLTDPRGIVKAKAAALDFLDKDLRPTDEIGVVSYTLERGLVFHEYLTTDHARVRAIVDGFAARPVAGRAENFTRYLFTSSFLAIPSPITDMQDRVADPENQFFENQASLWGRITADKGLQGAEQQSYVGQAQGLLVALGQMAKVLRYVPGFKNVVLFSNGVARNYLYGREGGVASLGDWTTPEQLSSQLGKYNSAQSNTLLRDEHQRMLKEFKASNCPIYSVDVSRGRNETDVSAIEGASGAAIRDFEGADSLRQLAGETDGKFYAKTMQPEAVAEDIQKTTLGYYVLGYSVTEAWDEAFHKIKVKVNRRGVDVRTQGGYYNPKPFSKYSRFEKLLHVIDLALSDSPGIAEDVADIPVVALPLTVKGAPGLLAYARLSREAHAEFLGKEAEAYFLLMNEKGDLAATRSFRLGLPDNARGIVFPSFLVPVKPGSYVGRIVLRNSETGRGARGASPVVIPDRPAAAFSLDPPLFLVPEKDAMDLTSSSGESLAGFYGFDSNQYAPFAGDVPAGAAKILAALRIPSGGAADLVIKASLLAPDAPASAAVPISILERSADGPTWFYLADISTGELSPGKYGLKIEAMDPKTGEMAVSSAVFTVK